MARARNIKPAFFKNPELGQCDPLARLLFAGLWCAADRDGKLQDRPALLKVELLPYDQCDVTALLEQLQRQSLIVRYAAAGARYILIPAFSRHQNPHHAEKAAGYPDPPAVSQTLTETGQASGSPETNPRQAAGEPGCSRADSLLLIPDSGFPLTDSLSCTEPAPLVVMEFATNKKGQAWPLTEAKLAEYVESFEGVDVPTELRRARQWLLDNPTKKKTAAGMAAFLGRWLGKAQNASSGRPAATNDGRTRQTASALNGFVNGGPHE